MEKTQTYDALPTDWFRRCGNSGLMLPAVSLGCWHNFGDFQHASLRAESEVAHHRNCRDILCAAFDRGITHFDLANNYGPPPGSAESRVGRILKQEFTELRDELVISSKAGYRMWEGPYGEGGGRKHLIASCDQSLKRLQLEYVDIFYSHRFDPHTPLEETMTALDHLVRTGKALYVGLSNYTPEQTERAVRICLENHLAVPVIHQPKYNLIDRKVENAGLFEILSAHGMGSICFSPLQGGLLAGKYLKGIPKDSRKAVQGKSGDPWLTEENLAKLQTLKSLAEECGRTLSQLVLCWAIRKGACTSALIGASRPEQIHEAAALLEVPLPSDGVWEKMMDLFSQG
ncbi:MAG: aldo/keto reductase [Verrucomicrobia bacterium]|nr:aldo/keto reductase [Verrucomicrobiota bacterium]MCH8510050.1 aldo/keto reductase [Kiritimatiellia bacterium]